MGLADIIETTTGFDSHLLRAFHSAICPQIAKSCGATLIDLGYADAKRYLSNCKLEGLALASEVTRMKDTNIGITFREMMKGPFALGAIEPHAGEAAGRAAGTTLAMHATILIDDLDAFIGERSHLGRIAGRIDFPPFGEEIPATRGIFNLFSSAEDSRAKLMVYELAFEHNDKRYYLAGHKKLKDDLGFGLWKDTTTLFTTLHCGDDKSGPIVGAGVLSLEPLELAKMVKTMHTINANSVAEKTRAAMKFGRFFLGNLWDSYLGV